MSAGAGRPVPTAFEMALAEMRDWHRAYSACRIWFHALAQEMIKEPVALACLPPDTARMICMLAVNEHYLADFIAPHIDPECRDSVMDRLHQESRLLCHQHGEGGDDADA